MVVDVESELYNLWVARRRRALAELDYRRAVLRVLDAGVSPEVVQNRLDVSPEALEGVLLRTRDTGVVPEGFSGASVKELCQRYEVGLLSAAQLEDELSAWPYDLAAEETDGGPEGASQHDVEGDGGQEEHHGTGEVPADVAARWFSDGAVDQAHDRHHDPLAVTAGHAAQAAGRGVPEPSGFRVSPDGQWREVEDARDAGLLTQEMYERVLQNVNPDISPALLGAVRR